MVVLAAASFRWPSEGELRRLRPHSSYRPFSVVKLTAGGGTSM